MFGLTDISVDFLSASPLAVGLALVTLLALSFLLYFRTNPPLPVYLRVILGIVRAVAVLALMGALLEPVIHFRREYERKPRVAVLTDRSGSMDHEELGKTRMLRLDSLRSTPGFRQLQDRTDVRTWYFGETVEASADRINRDKTALGEAIHELASRELVDPSDLWLLLSDGRSNSGRRPMDAARGLTVPVYAVNMAGDVGSFDVGLTAVDYNPVMFVGRKTEIGVGLDWRGADNEALQVQVLDDTKVLDEAQYALSQEDGLGLVTLGYVPEQPGQKLLRVRIPALETEESTGNNERTIAVKILKSRLKILLVTGRPDYEVGFLHRHLLQSDRYDADLAVTDPSAGNLSRRFPSRQTELNRYDLVVLHDPDPSAFDAHQGVIRSYLAEKGGAVWVIMGEQYAAKSPVDWFNELLPFAQSSRQRLQRLDFHGEPAEGHLFHPAIRLADDRSGIREAWAGVPPFKSLVRCDRVDPNSVVLARAAGAGLDAENLPILGYRRFGPGKLIASAALPVWHWGFVTLGFGEDDSYYRRFLDGVISWLTVPEDFDPIRIAPEKEVFNRGEVIRFAGFAFDQGFRPIPGVTGTVSLVGPGPADRYSADLVQIGEGRHVAEFTRVPPGKYQYEAEFDKGGQLLKRKNGEILVEAFSLEEFDQRGDPNSLMTVARLSGGNYYTYGQFNRAVAAIDPGPIIEREEGEVTVWGKLWLLAVFVGALAVEWVLRKVNQLI